MWNWEEMYISAPANSCLWASLASSASILPTRPRVWERLECPLQKARSPLGFVGTVAVDTEGKSSGSGWREVVMNLPPSFLPHLQQSYLLIGNPWAQCPMLVVLQQLHSLSEPSLQGKEKGHWGAQIQGSSNSPLWECICLNQALTTLRCYKARPPVHGTHTKQ